MASLSGAIQRVRRARREANASRENFDRYRPAYEEVLTAVAEEAGDEAFDELEEWILETTRAERALPTPGALRNRAQRVYRAHGVEIPDDSPIRG